MSIAGVVDYKSVLAQNMYKQVSNIDDSNSLNKSLKKDDDIVKDNISDSISISGSLSQGNSGQSVSELQKTLKDKNYYSGNVDGYFGEDTKNAVIKFQKSAGLEATGVANMQMKSELACSTSCLVLGSSGEEVKQLQNDLIKLGYDCGPSKADGSFGSATQSAVIRFQRDNGLEQDGIVGPATRKALKEALDSYEANKVENGGTTAEITSDLALGSQGEQVKQLQKDLISLGYNCGSCGADGSFGPDTKNAVIQFQKDKGLAQDGIVGPATREALKKALTSGGSSTTPVNNVSYLALGSTGEEVKQLQNDLIKLGYSCGSSGADGSFGPDTKAAVIKFQHDNGLVQDGCFGPDTKKALKEALASYEANKVENGGTTAEITSDLALGSQGEQVKQLQKDLISLGYNCGSCGADGSFGPDTKNAVIQFQKDKGLVQDGSVGPATREALKKALAIGGSSTTPINNSSYLALGSQSEEVKQLQNNLIKLGYSCGPNGADGSFGPATESAVERFQGNNGLVQDGSVGPATRDAIKKALDDLATNKNEGAGSNLSKGMPVDLFTFMDNFKRLKSLADKYYTQNKAYYGNELDNGDMLALKYVRKCNPSYANLEWEITAGGYPADFSEYLKQNDSSMVNYFNSSNEIFVTDPNSRQGQDAKMEMSHMIASLNGVLSPSPVSKEWCTWSGDLGQALKDLHAQQHKENYTQDDYNSLKEYAKTRIIGVDKYKVTNTTRFDILDLRGDVDAINIGELYKKEGKPIDKIIEEYYSGDGVANRYKTFIASYGGTDSLRKKANETYCYLKGGLDPNHVIKAATIDAFVEKVAELAGMNCNLLCPDEAKDVNNPVTKHTTIHDGTPINDDSDNRGRDDILPIHEPKEEI